jgi:isocitrate lyase
MSTLQEQIAAAEQWFSGPRFAHVVRLYSPRQVAEQQGSLPHQYPIAASAAEAFHARLRELFEQRRAITTFGPYSPGQAVTMKRLGIEGIYLGGWATSAKGSISEDPGADLASYPLSQVPDEAAPIVRALLTADRNQHFLRSRMTEEQRQATPEVDFRPFIIADADTGHGGDAHVRNLIRRFVEAGVPGYHIEDQKPGLKKCGHQGGKVLVTVDEQIKRLNAARFQLDVMRVPGILVARTDAESATLLESCSDERDQPFVLGAVNVDLPSYRAGTVAIHKCFFDAGVEEIRGHLLFALPEDELEVAIAWLRRKGLARKIEESAEQLRRAPDANPGAALNRIVASYAEQWEADAGLAPYGQAIAEAMELRAEEGETFELSVEEWRDFARTAGFRAAREKAESLGVRITWDCEHARTAEGYYQIAGGIDYAIAKSLAVAPFADLLWMETKTADLEEARRFAEAIHARHPHQMLAYNLSPSFSWDTTGMSDEEMARFPEELGKLGFVFNFITYGGHQIDGLAAEELATALLDDGMLALARLQRKFRLLESPYRTPQTLVGGPRLDAALMASSGRTATTAAMGKGSTQFQHLVQTEVPPKLLEEWLALWTKHYDLPKLRVQLRPATAASDLLELQLLDEAGEKVANVVFAVIQDRRGRQILSVRDQNTFAEALRKKRLMSLVHLFLIHRYRAGSVHYVTPTEDNRYQTRKMKSHRIFSDVHEEVGHIIVAEVDHDSIAELLGEDRVELGKLIDKTRKLREEPAEVDR